MLVQCVSRNSLIMTAAGGAVRWGTAGQLLACES